MEAQTIERLDEMALRRPPLAFDARPSDPGFRPGREVYLADRQAWTFPRPRAVFAIDSDSEDGLRLRYNLGPEYDRLRRALADAEDGRDVILAELRIGAFLLRLNYDLADSQISQLLEFGYDGDDDDGPESHGVAIRRAVMNVATGRREQGEASPVGSD